MSYPIIFDPPIEEEMVIHSLDGKLDFATITKQLGPNEYEAVYKGTKCTAVYNPFPGKFYVDDIYGIIEKVAQNSTKISKNKSDLSR